jgi:transposase
VNLIVGVAPCVGDPHLRSFRVTGHSPYLLRAAIAATTTKIRAATIHRQFPRPFPEQQFDMTVSMQVRSRAHGDSRTLRSTARALRLADGVRFRTPWKKDT